MSYLEPRTFRLTVTAAATSNLASLAASMSAGTWAQFTGANAMLDFTASIFRNNANTNYLVQYQDKAIWNPVHKQMRFFGHAHLSDNTLIQYDEDTNRWSSIFKLADGNPFTFPHAYQHNTVDPATGDHYFMLYGCGEIRRWDRAAEDWSPTIITVPTPNGGTTSGGLEWLPSIGSQGGFIFISDDTVRRWTKTGTDTGTWELVSFNQNGIDQSNNVICQRSVPGDFCYIGGGNTNNNIWKLGPTGGVSAIAQVAPTPVGIYSTVAVADPVTGDLITIRPSGVGNYYDDSAGVWVGMTGTRTPPNFGADIQDVLAAPISTYGVVMVFKGPATLAYLYKHA